MNEMVKTGTFKVSPHATNPRLRKVELEDTIIRRFLEACATTDLQELEYIPYRRMILADKLQELTGVDFVRTLSNILHDRASGGFTISTQGETGSMDGYVKFATAVSHLVGNPNFDSMSGTYYARFTVKDTAQSDSYLRQAYRLFTLHTDGTFVDEPTDWLLMMKMEERNSVGGESRLLHLDDWEDLQSYIEHPLSSYKFTYKAPPSKNVQQTVERTTFFRQNGMPCICFIDQFVYPDTVEQAKYLHDLSESMERSAFVKELTLPPGELVVLNNQFWLHGRASFQKHTELYRELLRIRGQFATT